MANRFFLLTATSIAATIAATMLAGCSDQSAVSAEQNVATATATSPQIANKSAAKASERPSGREELSGPTVGRNVEEETDKYFFSYSYPAEVTAIPALKTWLNNDLRRRKVKLAIRAKEAQADAKENGYEYRAHSFGNSWKRVAHTPRFLSLSSEITTFSGGAHGNMGFGSLLWDRKAGKRLAVLDVFTSKAAFSVAISKPFCDQLNRQRAKKRGQDYSKSSISEFDACINPARSTVILGSSDKKRVDKIGILIAPYEAGPYAEGSYEVTLPVTAALLKAVKPQYRDAFRVK